LLYELHTWETMRELEREARARLPGRVATVTRPALGARLARAAGPSAQALRRRARGLGRDLGRSRRVLRQLLIAYGLSASNRGVPIGTPLFHSQGG